MLARLESTRGSGLSAHYIRIIFLCVSKLKYNTFIHGLLPFKAHDAFCHQTASDIYHSNKWRGYYLMLKQRRKVQFPSQMVSQMALSSSIAHMWSIGVCIQLDHHKYFRSSRISPIAVQIFFK